MADLTEHTEYLRRNSKLPSYFPFPMFLLELDLSMTARVVYALLLNRAQLSIRNSWYDREGRVYIVYPIEELSADMHKSVSTMKEALDALEKVRLLERVRQGNGKPNRLYLRVPRSTAGNPAIPQPEMQPSDSRKSGPLTAGKPPPNNCTENPYKNNNTGVIPGRLVFGRYQNIWLTREEYAALKKDFGDDLERYIEEMSIYLSANGKIYQNYEAALQLWAANDKKKAARCGSKDYSYEGDDSL